MKDIDDMKENTVINSAIDFTEDAKPKLIQIALIPKESSSKYSTLVFDMEFKQNLSKALLSLVSKTALMFRFFIFIFKFRILKDSGHNQSVWVLNIP